MLEERKRREELEARLKQMEQQYVVGGVGNKANKETDEKKEYQEMLKKLQNHEEGKDEIDVKIR